MLNKDDILAMKTNDNENFQRNKYYHKAQQRTFINWFEKQINEHIPTLNNKRLFSQGCILAFGFL